MAAVAARGPDPAAAEDEEPKLAKIQTSFTLKLVKYDESKKIPLIKELKNIMDGMNLVQVCMNPSNHISLWNGHDFPVKKSLMKTRICFTGEEVCGGIAAGGEGRDVKRGS